MEMREREVCLRWRWREIEQGCVNLENKMLLRQSSRGFYRDQPQDNYVIDRIIYVAAAGFVGISCKTRRSDAAFGRSVRQPNEHDFFKTLQQPQTHVAAATKRTALLAKRGLPSRKLIWDKITGLCDVAESMV
ncbi:hypothetical protein YC2023_079723 [Brassica napus]